MQTNVYCTPHMGTWTRTRVNVAEPLFKHCFM